MFDPAIIFHRTSTGRDEIQQKSHGLTQSERLVLIMVDGVSTYQQVRSKLPVLTDDRFARAVGKLQAKELILEVFLPVEGQTPEELERTVIDRFLQQDPLDPVTIMLRDPEEELEYLAQFSTKPKTAPESEPPIPAKEASNAAPAPASSTSPQAPPTPASAADFDVDELHTELLDEFARQLKERQQSKQRPERTEHAEHRAARRSSSRSTRAEEEPHAIPKWTYWIIAVGCAFIAGYLLARIGS